MEVEAGEEAGFGEEVVADEVAGAGGESGVTEHILPRHLCLLRPHHILRNIYYPYVLKVLWHVYCTTQLSQVWIRRTTFLIEGLGLLRDLRILGGPPK